jgi:hypothetical protein
VRHRQLGAAYAVADAMFDVQTDFQQVRSAIAESLSFVAGAGTRVWIEKAPYSN